MSATPTHVVPADGSVFDALGLDREDSLQTLVKARLLGALEDYVATFPTQVAAAAALGTDAARVSEITNGRIGKFSTDKLLALCEAAGIAVTVTAALDRAHPEALASA